MATTDEAPGANPTAASPAPEQDHLLSNQTYDRLKFIALILLPALGALYFGVAQIWGLPAGTEVVGTVAVLDTFLGGLIKVGDASYNASDSKFDGVINVSPDQDRVRFLVDDPLRIPRQDTVTLKVNKDVDIPEHTDRE